MERLPDGEKKLKICLFISTESTNVTDRQADRQIPPNGIGRARIASRGKSTVCLSLESDQTKNLKATCRRVQTLRIS